MIQSVVVGDLVPERVLDVLFERVKIHRASAKRTFEKRNFVRIQMTHALPFRERHTLVESEQSLVWMKMRCLALLFRGIFLVENRNIGNVLDVLARQFLERSIDQVLKFFIGYFDHSYTLYSISFVLSQRSLNQDFFGVWEAVVPMRRHACTVSTGAADQHEIACCCPVEHDWRKRIRIAGCRRQ